jgi:hypothetical protein
VGAGPGDPGFDVKLLQEPGHGGGSQVPTLLAAEQGGVWVSAVRIVLGELGQKRNSLKDWTARLCFFAHAVSRIRHSEPSVLGDVTQSHTRNTVAPGRCDPEDSEASLRAAEATPGSCGLLAWLQE